MLQWVTRDQLTKLGVQLCFGRTLAPDCFIAEINLPGSQGHLSGDRIQTGFGRKSAKQAEALIAAGGRFGGRSMWASCRSIASGFHQPISLSSV